MSFFDSKRLVGFIAVLLVATVAACGGKDKVRDGSEFPPYDESSSGSGSSTSGIDSSRLNERGLQGVARSDRERFLDPNDPLSTRVFYFDFDSDRVRSEYMASVKAHAEYAARTGVTVRLEGHTDERGTREYNVGLGERRAQAVQRLLAAHGVPNSNLRVLSFGEERPQELGHSEAAWSKNRRVEIIYEK
ncbi:MAG: peptidoglycan-associated lipoprotein Pal [Salinisphaeraceae bacterium]|nr:peptidoglycan-associated lipoprotein Pal [Salinisphaeraceae bacterium]